MASFGRPSVVERTMSSPSLIKSPSIIPSDNGPRRPSKLHLNILTPPASPRHSRSSSDLFTKTNESFSDDELGHKRGTAHGLGISTVGWSGHDQTSDGILICPYQVELLNDQRDRPRIFGHGAWSTVFGGTCHEKPTAGVFTPPLSPARKPPVLVAVKQPSRKDAKEILRSEAKIFSYLGSRSGYDRYVIEFYGILLESSSLVLAAMPLSLEEHIKRSAISARASRSTWNMTEPVIGSTTTWLDLVYKLVSALCWLHEDAMVVHGDLKPGNVLLSPLSHSNSIQSLDNLGYFPFEPVFADFSSSQRLDESPSPNTLSAITREYTAPELLSSKVLLNPNSTATKASDVFSLAVTLLVAATGNTMVYSGSVYQRQAMATQGWMVIQAVRNGPMEESARVPRQGLVERVLERAVLRENFGRIDAIRWRSIVEDFTRGEPSKRLTS